MTANEFKLDNCPSDGISSINFSPSTSQFLLTSSWDTSVRLYDVTENSQRFRYDHSTPVLDCCFSDSVHAWSGGLDGSLVMFDFNVGKQNVIGVHNDAIRCLEFCPETNMIASGSWDQTVKLWDARSQSSIGSYSQPGKVYTMSVCGHRLIVGTNGKCVVVWDMRNMGYVEQRRDSSLKYQTRCIKSFPNKQGFVLSSIEGRVAVEYLDPSAEVQKKKYAFKCHRIKEDGIECVYSVHAIAFHNRYNTFATGGGDGFVNMWDGFNKKRLCQFHKFPAPISSIAFTNDGSMLAVAASPLYSHKPSFDKDDNVGDAIYIRNVSDAETKPKLFHPMWDHPGHLFCTMWDDTPDDPTFGETIYFKLISIDQAENSGTVIKLYSEHCSLTNSELQKNHDLVEDTAPKQLPAFLNCDLFNTAAMKNQRFILFNAHIHSANRYIDLLDYGWTFSLLHKLSV